MAAPAPTVASVTVACCSVRCWIRFRFWVHRCRGLTAVGGALDRIARAGELFVVGEGVARVPEIPDLTACVPLKLDGRVTGAIVVFRLLAHKPALQRVDHEVFELLATHVATALYCASLHVRFGGDARALDAGGRS